MLLTVKRWRLCSHKTLSDKRRPTNNSYVFYAGMICTSWSRSFVRAYTKNYIIKLAVGIFLPLFVIKETLLKLFVDVFFIYNVIIGTGKGYNYFGNDHINHIIIILEIYFTDQKNYGGIREIEKTFISKSLSSSANI